MGKEALDYILSPIYESLVEDTKRQNIFCHHDFTYSNILFNEEGPAIINFDYCCFDLKVYDIANFIRRRVRKCNWDIDEAKIITDEYRNIEEPSPEDFYVMKLILQFPQKFGEWVIDTITVSVPGQKEFLLKNWKKQLMKLKIIRNSLKIMKL